MLALIAQVMIFLLFTPTFLYQSKAVFSISLPHIIQLSMKLSFSPIRPLLFSSLLPKLLLFLIGLLLSHQVPVLTFSFLLAKILPSRSTFFPSQPVWLLVQPVNSPKQKLRRFPG